MPKLPKLKYQLPRFGLLVSGLSIVTLLTALSGLWHYQYEVAHQSYNMPVAGKNIHAQVLAASHSSITTSPGSTLNKGSQSAVSGTFGSSNSRSVASQNATATGLASNSSTNTQQPVNGSTLATHIAASLSVNGQNKGAVQLPIGSNQCAVLTQALTDGLISNLDMRYSSEYQTEAVYVIDGLGDPGAVWWTYKVNGVAPPYGCAYIKVHDNDSINWQYVKK